MCMTPSPPPPPAPPPEAPNFLGAVGARNSELNRQRAAFGASNTILTGNQGLGGAGNTGKTVLGA